jgi:competence protein ComEC
VRHRPLLLPLAGLIAGAIAAAYQIAFGVWPLVIVLVGSAVFLYFRSLSLPAVTLISLAGAITANMLVSERLVPPPGLMRVVQLAADQPVTLSGLVQQRPEKVRNGSRLVVACEDKQGTVPGQFMLQVVVGTGMPVAATGDLIRFSGRIKLPRPLELPGEFNRQRYLAWQGIHATSYVANAAEVEVLASGEAFPVRRWFDQLAMMYANDLEASLLPPVSGILKALLLGIRGDIPPDVERLYAVTGVNHILSVSGFHVGVLALTLAMLCNWLGRCSVPLMLWGNVRRWSVLVSFPLIIGYLLLTGMAAATVRSVLMLAAVCVAVLDEREHDHLDTLILAAVVMLATAPWLLFTITFQLSFLALWGVLVLTPVLIRQFPLVPSLLGQQLLTVTAASLAAILATAPAVAYYFHLFSLTGIIANLFVVPLMGYGAVVIGFAGLVLASVLSPVAHWFFLLAGKLVESANWGVGIVAKLPVWRGVSPTLFETLLITVIVMTLGLRKMRWRLALMTSLAACLVMIRFLGWNADRSSLQLTFLSVGQAEATLVRMPSGQSMLVDTGGTPVRDDVNWGERILLPALWRLGIRRLDYLVLTHPHADHVGGAADLIVALPIGELWCGGNGDDPDWQPLINAAQLRGIPIRFVDGRTSDKLLGQVRFDPLWPLPQGGAGDANDRSLVFRLSWHDFSILFAGDIGWEVADYLARIYGRSLASTVLKVPHHGSRYSDAPSLYRAVQPQWAVISAGYRNRFGLPSAEVLSALHVVGIQLLRTDLDGTIHLHIAKERQPPKIQRHFGQFN